MDNFYKKDFRRGLILALFLFVIFSAYYFSRSTCAAGLVPCTNDCNLCYLLVGISNIFQWLMGSLLSVTVILGVTIAGLSFIVSGAFPKALAFAKSSIANTAKGAILALCAWLIINGVMNIVGYKHPFGGEWYQFECSGNANTQTAGTTCDTKNKKLESITIQCAGQKKTLPDNGSAFYLSLKTQKSMSQQMKAIGKFTCDGKATEEDITAQVEWKSSDETQIKVSKGLVQAVTDSLRSSVPYVEAKYKEKSSNQAKVYINSCPAAKVGKAEIKTENKFSFPENSFAIPRANAQNMTDPILTDPVGQPIGADDTPKRIEPLVSLPDPFDDCPTCGGAEVSCLAVARNVLQMVGWKFANGANGKTNLRMEYGYGDCSSITSRAYTEAGCENPGESSDAIGANGLPYSGDASSLKTGDILSFSGPKGGHTTICIYDGCPITLGATIKDGILLAGVGADYWSDGAKHYGILLKVTKCSDFCGIVNQDYELE